jgi:hypothetical protein
VCFSPDGLTHRFRLSDRRCECGDEHGALESTLEGATLWRHLCVSAPMA